MPWSGAVFQRLRSWVSDRANAIPIRADYHDNHDDDLAAGIQACVKKDGTNAFTGDADLGGNALTNLGPSNVTFNGKFPAAALPGAAGSTSSGSEAALNWSTPTFDDLGIWSSGSPPVLTVPSGVLRWRIWGQIAWEPNATGYRKVRLLRNGSDSTNMGTGTAQSIGAGDITVVPFASAVLSVSPGDTFQVLITQTSGGVLAVRPTDCFVCVEQCW